MSLDDNALGISDVELWARQLEALLETERAEGDRWTVTAIKEASGVSRATVHAILARGRKHLGRQTLRRLAKLPVANVAGAAHSGAPDPCIELRARLRVIRDELTELLLDSQGEGRGRPRHKAAGRA